MAENDLTDSWIDVDSSDEANIQSINSFIATPISPKKEEAKTLSSSLFRKLNDLKESQEGSEKARLKEETGKNEKIKQEEEEEEEEEEGVEEEKERLKGDNEEDEEEEDDEVEGETETQEAKLTESQIKEVEPKEEVKEGMTSSLSSGRNLHDISFQLVDEEEEEEEALSTSTGRNEIPSLTFPSLTFPPPIASHEVESHVTTGSLELSFQSDSENATPSPETISLSSSAEVETKQLAITLTSSIASASINQNEIESVLPAEELLNLEISQESSKVEKSDKIKAKSQELLEQISAAIETTLISEKEDPLRLNRRMSANNTTAPIVSNKNMKNSGNLNPSRQHHHNNNGSNSNSNGNGSSVSVHSRLNHDPEQPDEKNLQPLIGHYNSQIIDREISILPSSFQSSIHSWNPASPDNHLNIIDDSLKHLQKFAPKQQNVSLKFRRPAPAEPPSTSSLRSEYQMNIEQAEEVVTWADFMEFRINGQRLSMRILLSALLASHLVAFSFGVYIGKG